MKVLALGGLLLLVVALPPPAVGEAECNPEPVGRCGNYDRETVILCYIKQGSRYLSPTDPTGAPMVIEGEDALLYYRAAPADGFLADPWEAPLPRSTLFVESNHVPGLQRSKFFCGQFVWYPECYPGVWMGPYGAVDKDPDLAVV